MFFALRTLGLAVRGAFLPWESFLYEGMFWGGKMYQFEKMKGLKWSDYPRLLLMSLLIGLLTGLGVTVFGKGLVIIADLREVWKAFLLPLLSVSGLVIVWLYHRFGKTSGRGLQMIFETGQGQQNTLPKRMPILAVFSTWLTHLFGGSAGRTGVVVQIGAVAGQLCGSCLRQADHQRLLIVTGMAAGFAGLFQAPLAATAFACEILVLGHFQLFALFPSFIAAWVSFLTTRYLGLSAFSYSLPDFDALNVSVLLKVVILGLLFGLVGDVFAFTLIGLRRWWPTFFPNPYCRMLILGSLLSITLMVLHFGRYSGTGAALIPLAFEGGGIYSYDWFWKLVLTILTMSIGFQGGEVTPLFTIGATLGSVLAVFFQLPVGLVAALGCLSVFGSATNTLLVPIILGAEVFGWHHLPLFMLCSFVATRFNRHMSIYPFQFLLEN